MIEKVHVIVEVDPNVETIIKPVAAALAKPMKLGSDNDLKLTGTGTATGTGGPANVDADGDIDVDW